MPKRLGLLIVPALFMYGCYTFSGASIPEGMQSFSIITFESRAPLAPPVTATQFTETLKNKIINQTNLSLNQDQGSGDIYFEGSITGFNVQPVALTGGQTAEQSRLTITVSVKCTNNINPDASFETSFNRYRDFPAGQSLQAVQDQMIADILPELADDVFNQAFVNW